MLKIIDSHVHFWHPETFRYTWLDESPTIDRPFLPGDLPQGGRDWMLERVVFVQAECIHEQALAETEWVAALAAQGAPIAGIVAFAPLERGEGARPTLEHLKAMPLVKGVRRLIQWESPGFSTQPGFIEGVRMLEQYDYPFDICIFHRHFEDALTLVNACPNVRFVLDHLGKPGIAAGLLDPWRDHLRRLAAYPNVSCKLSGMVTEADHSAWEPEQLKPYLDHALECFGIERVMFGSDWPVMRLAATYELWLETLRDAVSQLNAHEQARLFHDNAKAFYRL